MSSPPKKKKSSTLVINRTQAQCGTCHSVQGDWILDEKQNMLYRYLFPTPLTLSLILEELFFLSLCLLERSPSPRFFRSLLSILWMAGSQTEREEKPPDLERRQSSQHHQAEHFKIKQGGHSLSRLTFKAVKMALSFFTLLRPSKRFIQYKCAKHDTSYHQAEFQTDHFHSI